ncbi:MAG: cytochrome P460 family protein [Nitrospirota bacterium]|nr:cytochrome P460 family protein [Nitrospirota bacterium]MDP3596083.1 cytochrome P460 family protein [Nitrospirota bacterium]
MNHDQEYPELIPVVVRLMAIALGVTTRSVAAPEQTQQPMAFGYRSWPTCQIAGHQQGHEEILKFYVCPKGAATLDDEPFSLGTRFVMETYRVEEDRFGQGSAKKPARHELVQVFSMQKYASLERSGLRSCAVDGWLFSTFVQAGVPSRSARITIGAGLRGWTALTTQGVLTEGDVCPYVSLSHILERRYVSTAQAS